MAILVKEANKLTLRQEIHIVAPHVVEGLLKASPDRWMTNACIIQYQALLIDQNIVKFSPGYWGGEGGGGVGGKGGGGGSGEK
jgi:hypothetical protein